MSRSTLPAPPRPFAAALPPAALPPAALLLTFLLAGQLGCRPPASHAQAETAGGGATLDRVVAAPPVRRDMELRSLQPARIESFETAPLHSKIAGYVEEVAVDIGDRVVLGQTLLRLRVPELHDDLEHGEAELARVEAEVLQAEAAQRAAQAGIRAAQARREQVLAGVEGAQAVRARWQSERGRITELASTGSVTARLAEESEFQFHSAEAAWKQAQAAVTVEEAAVVQAEVRLEQAIADVEAAKAKRRVAAAEASHARSMLGYTEMKAPFDGVVTRRAVDTGRLVLPAAGAGAEPLLVVARTDRLRVVADIPEMEAPYVQAGEQGDSAVVRVQALPGREFPGRIARTGWSLTDANRSLRVEVELENEEEVLRAGLYAQVEFLLDRRENALALPVAAVTRREGVYYCCVVNGGVIERRAVQLGIRDGGYFEILDGVSTTDLVVQARTESLNDGQRVEVAQPE